MEHLITNNSDKLILFVKTEAKVTYTHNNFQRCIFRPKSYFHYKNSTSCKGCSYDLNDNKNKKTKKKKKII